jgi:hypothetical protein
MGQLVSEYKRYKEGEEKEEDLEKILEKARKYYKEKGML